MAINLERLRDGARRPGTAPPIRRTGTKKKPWGTLLFIFAAAGLYQWCKRRPPEPPQGRQQSTLRAGSARAPQGTAAACAAAQDPANDLLASASKAVDEKARKAADVTPAHRAAKFAEGAAHESPACAEAWSTLALARYRVAYDICGRGDYRAALNAAQTALQLEAPPQVKVATLQTLGRISAAQLNWGDASKWFNEALMLDSANSETISWLAQLRVAQSLRPPLLQLVSRVFRGDELDASAFQGLTKAESKYVANAVLARRGRRMNVGPLDWLFYCSNSPIANRPNLDLNAKREDPVQGTLDFENLRLAMAFANGQL